MVQLGVQRGAKEVKGVVVVVAAVVIVIVIATATVMVGAVGGAHHW
jgi:hypothetical protein